ncbi:type II toxin-antitoxin system death-on-curing family toxin [Deinococcus arcticus]|uniref:Type II toxin-antitoxin system death-on-curing family toxin n=1 Tax=Deinococcus arcticus TaxID=2136176 RepID=A0A2T3W840_9DEIO|nr:Fic family protein [Deinococcus arcticus]PTA67964.1 type II toxin-antitoxin system death-on-curing family toxin [Deinococcus arcticus]
MSRSGRYFDHHHGWAYPTPAFVHLVHDGIFQISPGRAGVAHPGVIESATAKATDSAFGDDAYPTLFTKVAAIGSTLAHDHGFSDGNKRTALQVMLLTLKRNGLHPNPSAREAATVMVLVAMGACWTAPVCGWP